LTGGSFTPLRTETRMTPRTFPPTAPRRPGDEPVMLVRSRRPESPSDPTAEDRLGSIEDRLDRIEALAREVLDGLTALAARLDKDSGR
jgi:hypothetical protein